MSSPESRDAGAVSALRVSGISKTFAGGKVLDGFELTLRPGEIRALVGENGSGKSTFVKILAGFHHEDPGGSIEVAGRSLLAQHGDVGREEAGIRFVHQDLGLVGGLSAVENLGLGGGYGARPGAPVRWRRRRSAAQALLRGLGYGFDVDRPVALLTASERTAVAIARAISPQRAAAHVLVLDEPTANLPGAEVERLFALVRRLRDRGIAILFISHHLDEVFRLADSVTVLRGGRLVRTARVAELDESRLIELMVGHGVDRSGVRQHHPRGAAVLEASDLIGDTVLGLDLAAHAGEIVGVAGITGSGREAVAGLLFGTRPRAGRVSVSGVAIPPASPRASRDGGMALVPADRAASAVLAGHTVLENLTIARLRDVAPRWRLRRRIERRVVRTWLEALDVRPQTPDLLLSALSGGNAQKVVLARWLRLEPAVLVLDEPTQGVDVGAKEDIHRRLESAAAEGAVVVVCSTDNEELARVCDRVLVMSRGRAAAELHAPLHADDITYASLAEERRSA